MGFVDPAHPDLVCCLHKYLYGLKQAPRVWYSRFATYVTALRFIEVKSDTSLFIFRCGSAMVYLLLYVDDIILTVFSTELLHRTISALQREFIMKDLGALHHFLGITVEHRPDGLFLHQRTYTLDILKCMVMAYCKLCTTPVDLQVKLAGDSGPPVEDVSQFRSIAGTLQYLTFTRPDIAYVVQQICLHSRQLDCFSQRSPLSPAQGKVTQVKIMLMPSSLNQVKERLKEESSWQAQACSLELYLSLKYRSPYY
jgi:hypothetical protein